MAPELLEQAGTEQRSHRRYPIRLDVQYRVLGERGTPRSGSGRTLNMSTGGILFQPEDALPEQVAIELILSWPFLLDRACNLNLCVHGRIVRSDARGTAVSVQQHEFRTTKRR